MKRIFFFLCFFLTFSFLYGYGGDYHRICGRVGTCNEKLSFDFKVSDNFHIEKHEVIESILNVYVKTDSSTTKLTIQKYEETKGGKHGFNFGSSKYNAHGYKDDGDEILFDVDIGQTYVVVAYHNLEHQSSDLYYILNFIRDTTPPISSNIKDEGATGCQGEKHFVYPDYKTLGVGFYRGFSYTYEITDPAIIEGALNGSGVKKSKVGSNSVAFNTSMKRWEATGTGVGSFDVSDSVNNIHTVKRPIDNYDGLDPSIPTIDIPSGISISKDGDNYTVSIPLDATDQKGDGTSGESGVCHFFDDFNHSASPFSYNNKTITFEKKFCTYDKAGNKSGFSASRTFRLPITFKDAISFEDNQNVEIQKRVSEGAYSFIDKDDGYTFDILMKKDLFDWNDDEITGIVSGNSFFDDPNNISNPNNPSILEKFQILYRIDGDSKQDKVVSTITKEQDDPTDFNFDTVGDKIIIKVTIPEEHKHKDVQFFWRTVYKYQATDDESSTSARNYFENGNFSTTISLSERVDLNAVNQKSPSLKNLDRTIYNTFNSQYVGKGGYPLYLNIYAETTKTDGITGKEVTEPRTIFENPIRLTSDEDAQDAAEIPYGYKTGGSSYVVYYNADGGVNAPVDNTLYFVKDPPYVIKSEEPTKDSFTFVGWTKVDDDDGTFSDPLPLYPKEGEDSVKLTKSTTFYAVWRCDETDSIQAVNSSNITEFYDFYREIEPLSLYLKPGEKAVFEMVSPTSTEVPSFPLKDNEGDFLVLSPIQLGIADDAKSISDVPTDVDGDVSYFIENNKSTFKVVCTSRNVASISNMLFSKGEDLLLSLTEECKTVNCGGGDCKKLSNKFVHTLKGLRIYWDDVPPEIDGISVNLKDSDANLKSKAYGVGSYHYFPLSQDNDSIFFDIKGSVNEKKSEGFDFSGLDTKSFSFSLNPNLEPYDWENPENSDEYGTGHFLYENGEFNRSGVYHRETCTIKIADLAGNKKTDSFHLVFDKRPILSPNVRFDPETPPEAEGEDGVDTASDTGVSNDLMFNAEFGYFVKLDFLDLKEQLSAEPYVVSSYKGEISLDLVNPVTKAVENVVFDWDSSKVVSNEPKTEPDANEIYGKNEFKCELRFNDLIASNGKLGYQIFPGSKIKLKFSSIGMNGTTSLTSTPLEVDVKSNAGKISKVFDDEITFDYASKEYHIPIEVDELAVGENYNFKYNANSIDFTLEGVETASLSDSDNGKKVVLKIPHTSIESFSSTDYPDGLTISLNSDKTGFVRFTDIILPRIILPIFGVSLDQKEFLMEIQNKKSTTNVEVHKVDKEGEKIENHFTVACNVNSDFKMVLSKNGQSTSFPSSTLDKDIIAYSFSWGGTSYTPFELTNEQEIDFNAAILRTPNESESDSLFIKAETGTAENARSFTLQINFAFDNEGPVFEISPLTPLDKEEVFLQNNLFDFSVIDSGSGLDEESSILVEIGETSVLRKFSHLGEAHSLEFGEVEGEYRIIFTLVDKAKNKTMKSITVFYDVTAPSFIDPLPVISTGLLAGGYTSADFLTLSLKAQEAVSGIKTISYKIVEEGKEGEDSTIYSQSFGHGTGREIGINGLSSLKPGVDYSISLKLEDKCGNSSGFTTFDTLKFYFDNRPPLLENVLQVEQLIFSNGTYFYGGTIEDLPTLRTAKSQDPQKELKNNSEGVILDEHLDEVELEGSKNYRVETLEDGKCYRTYIESETVSGVQACLVSSDTFIFDSTPPLAPVLTTKNSTFMRGEIVLFTVSANDAESGISNYLLRIGTSEDPDSLTSEFNGNEAGWVEVASMEGIGDFLFMAPETVVFPEGVEEMSLFAEVQAINPLSLSSVSKTKLPLTLLRGSPSLDFVTFPPYQQDILIATAKFTNVSTIPAEYKYRVYKKNELNEEIPIIEETTVENSDRTLSFFCSFPQSKIAQGEAVFLEISSQLEDGNELVATKSTVIDFSEPELEPFDIPEFSRANNFKISFTAKDPESGISSVTINVQKYDLKTNNFLSSFFYSYEMPSSSTPQDFLEKTDLLLNKDAMGNSLARSIEAGAKLKIYVTPTNKAGASSETYIRDVIIDETPPLAYKVLGATALNSKSKIHISWEKSGYDGESGLKKNQYRLYKLSQRDEMGEKIEEGWRDLAELESRSLVLSETLLSELPEGTTFVDGDNWILELQAINQCGRITRFENPFRIDDTCPIIDLFSIHTGIKSEDGSVYLNREGFSALSYKGQLKGKEDVLKLSDLTIEAYKAGKMIPFDGTGDWKTKVDFTYTPQLDSTTLFEVSFNEELIEKLKVFFSDKELDVVQFGCVLSDEADNETVLQSPILMIIDGSYAPEISASYRYNDQEGVEFFWDIKNKEGIGVANQWEFFIKGQSILLERDARVTNHPFTGLKKLQGQWGLTVLNQAGLSREVAVNYQIVEESNLKLNVEYPSFLTENKLNVSLLIEDNLPLEIENPTRYQVQYSIVSVGDLIEEKKGILWWDSAEAFESDILGGYKLLSLEGLGLSASSEGYIVALRVINSANRESQWVVSELIQLVTEDPSDSTLQVSMYEVKPNFIRFKIEGEIPQQGLRSCRLSYQKRKGPSLDFEDFNLTSPLVLTKGFYAYDDLNGGLLSDAMILYLPLSEGGHLNYAEGETFKFSLQWIDGAGNRMFSDLGPRKLDYSAPVISLPLKLSDKDSGGSYTGTFTDDIILNYLIDDLHEEQQVEVKYQILELGVNASVKSDYSPTIVEQSGFEVSQSKRIEMPDGNTTFGRIYQLTLLATDSNFNTARMSVLFEKRDEAIFNATNLLLRQGTRINVKLALQNANSSITTTDDPSVKILTVNCQYRNNDEDPITSVDWNLMEDGQIMNTVNYTAAEIDARTEKDLRLFYKGKTEGLGEPDENVYVSATRNLTYNFTTYIGEKGSVGAEPVSSPNFYISLTNTSVGKLFANEYWDSRHILLDRVIVPENRTLFVGDSAGQEVEIYSELTIGELIVEGKLQVEGPANFTADVAWLGILLEPSSRYENSSLSLLRINRAARALTVFAPSLDLRGMELSNNNVGIHVLAEDVTIGSCIFYRNKWYGIKEELGYRPVVENCAFDDFGFKYYDAAKNRVVDDALLINGLTGLNVSTIFNSGNTNSAVEGGSL